MPGRPLGAQLFCARNTHGELPPRLVVLMRGQNSLEADQSSHPPFCEASVDVFGHERAINFTHDEWRSNVGRR
jgi:hypothetical protein